MITLGITGRSGCGKSTVTAVFSAHGVPLADADQISREMLLPSSPLLPVLARRFGADILRSDGSLDRRLLADRAFAAPEGKAALDAITHPEIVRRILAWAGQAVARGQPLCFVDGAVVVGARLQPHCWRIVVVTAPEAVSVQRICARDGIAPEMARRRLDAQLPLERQRAAAVCCGGLPDTQRRCARLAAATGRRGVGGLEKGAICALKRSDGYWRRACWRCWCCWRGCWC